MSNTRTPKHVFIFTGGPMCGKTVLTKHLTGNVIIQDDLPLLSNHGEGYINHTFKKLEKYNSDYIIFITSYKENIEIIKKYYPDIPVSVCEFKAV